MGKKIVDLNIMENSDVLLTQKLYIHDFFLPLNKETAENLFFLNNNKKISFTFHPCDAYKKEFFITLISEKGKEQIRIKCDCLESILSNNMDQNKIYICDYISNIITCRIKQPMQISRNIIVKYGFRNSLPANK
ncbi:hypothetical protein HZS_3029 [Henneguya salminicola]|nr:hypothetical protein HZS_3029 [Henneguya salminicola]